MYMNCMKGNTSSRECSGALIVSIGKGQSVLRPYMVNSKDVIKKYPTIMLEAVTDQQLLFWHAYFGVLGANKDLNVLYGSPLLDDLLTDRAPEAPFVVSGKTYKKGYYLADGVYPQWSTFVKGFTIARDQKTMKFKRVQESARKYIKRAFRVLQVQGNLVDEKSISSESNGLVTQPKAYLSQNGSKRGFRVRMPSNDFKASFFLILGFYSELRDFTSSFLVEFKTPLLYLMNFEMTRKSYGMVAMQGVWCWRVFVYKEVTRRHLEALELKVMMEVLIRSQQPATKNRGKAIVNSPPPTYDQETDMVTEDDALSKDKEIDKLMALISLSFKRIYKPTNNNLKTSSNTKVAFWKSICYIHDLKGNDILTGSRGTYLYSITLQNLTSPNPICLMAKASSSQAWLWHCRLFHLNFDTISLLLKYDIVTGLPKLKFVKDHLCSSCELGKAKRYSTMSRAYRVYNKRTRLIVETIQVNFDKLLQMASDYASSDRVPQYPKMALEQDSLSLDPKSQENIPHVAKTVITSNELDLLFSPMFDELLNGTTPVVSNSSVVLAANVPDTTLSTSTTVAVDTPPLNIQTTPETTS
nr:hypothetical protein [Tanacetum cinerariifolium]